MKFIYPFLFLIVLSCSTVKKEYVCGDHPCVNKKEFNEYFSKNLIIEIKSKKNKKNKNLDLVKLNTETSSGKKQNDTNSKKDEKIKLKDEKIKLKEEKKNSKIKKNRLLEEQKKQEVNKANKIIKKSKTLNISGSKELDKRAINEISNNREGEKKIVRKTLLKEEEKSIKNTKKTIPVDTIKNVTSESICTQIKDCDIDKISELLIKKGRDKPFPNIVSY